MRSSALDDELVMIGLRPALQKRSHDTRLSLLSACRELVDHMDFAALPIEQICQTAGCSVGAFYNHFATKDVLLQALVVWVCLDARTAIDGACDVSDETLLERLILLTVLNYRTNQSFLRAVTRVAIDNQSVWAPIKRLGQYLVTSYVETRESQLSADAEAQLRFGFQAMFGILNNELVNAPGPYGLDHPELPARLLTLVAS